MDGMDIKQFLEAFGAQELERVAKKAGTTLGYLRDQVANGHRNVSTDLAKRLAKESGQRMTLPRLRPDIWGQASSGARRETA